MTIWIVFVVLLILLGFWLYKCINILKPNRIAIVTFFGRPRRTHGPGGLVWIWWPIQILHIYPNDVMELHFTTESVITRRGIVQGYDNQPVEPAEIDLVCTLYLQFERDNLTHTIRNTNAKDAKGLGPIIIPYVMDTIRAVVSRVPWRLVNQERHVLADWVKARLVGGNYLALDVPKQKGTGDNIEEIFGRIDDDNVYEEKNLSRDNLEGISPFVQFGLQNVSLAVEDVNFTLEEMKKTIFVTEQARLNAEATRLAADAESYKRSKEGKGDADAREAMLKVIKEAGTDLELLDALRDMAKGTSNTILYQIPEAFAQKMGAILGKNSLPDILQKLSPQQQQQVVDFINKQIGGTSQ